MPIREFGCRSCHIRTEIIHPSFDPETVPRPSCSKCEREMSLLVSVPRIDTSSTFNRNGGGPFTWRGPTGLYHEINNMHQLRQVEHTYQESGHDVRFDAWSANQNNPDTVDGFGQPYWDGDDSHTDGKVFVEV